MSDNIDRYQEVAERIVSVIKDDSFESNSFDST
jgi:hypothetical protein